MHWRGWWFSSCLTFYFVTLSHFVCSCVRCERLEEQLNDLTELHQNEIHNLKQELASMEEKIAYQSNERARDIQVLMSNITVIVLPFNLDTITVYIIYI